ncbi:MAG: alpha/beta hydrolase [Candidatus Omnitrophica bacterium]|nr:alpha/beta hydrolase [Candidatus Omnitrophota bacterium]
MKKSQRNILVILVIVIATVTCTRIVTVSHTYACNLITHPLEARPCIKKFPRNYNLPYRDVTVTSADGLKLVGWYIPSQNGAVVIAQHGYKSDRTEMLEEAQMLYRHGYSVLLTSIRAHDRSEGEQISFGHREMQDLEAWYQYLLTCGDVDPNRIGIIGNSMGGSLAIQYAAQNENIKAVVAHSAFSSLNDTVSVSINHFTSLPSFPFASLIVFWAEKELDLTISDIDAAKWIQHISPRPVFLMHGGSDTQISIQSGELLYAAAQEPKTLWYEQELGHAKFDETLPEEYERRVTGFFDRYLLLEEPSELFNP